MGSASLDLIPLLHEFYGPVHAPPSDLFQFVVWEVLSEHAAPARRDLAWSALRRIPALTPDAMSRAPAKALADAVALTGAPRDETMARLRDIVDTFKRQRDTIDAATAEGQSALTVARAIRAIPRIDASTRRLALLFATGLPVLAVDEAIGRVIQRLNEPIDVATVTRAQMSMTSSARPRRAARRWLQSRLPRDRAVYREAVTYLRHHGRHTCLAVGPHCQVCPLAPQCRSSLAASAFGRKH